MSEMRAQKVWEIIGELMDTAEFKELVENPDSEADNTFVHRVRLLFLALDPLHNLPVQATIQQHVADIRLMCTGSRITHAKLIERAIEQANR